MANGRADRAQRRLPRRIRLLKAGTRKVTHRIANILRLTANALSREQGRMGEFVRHFKGRLGQAEGIVVSAHKLARIIWGVLSWGCPNRSWLAVSWWARARNSEARPAGKNF
jgi:hypothetical protein